MLPSEIWTNAGGSLAQSRQRRHMRKLLRLNGNGTIDERLRTGRMRSVQCATSSSMQTPAGAR